MRSDYPGSESSRELSLPGAKVLSGNFRSEEWKYQGAKSPDTFSIMALALAYALCVTCSYSYSSLPGIIALQNFRSGA